MAIGSHSRPYTAHVVVHTHWDREWYSPFQTMRLRLVRLLDHVLSLLDAEPGLPYFTLDGQTICVDDYLAVRPENADRLRRHIRAGRLLVGPWYQMPDEFLVSGEALLRNLLRGCARARELGHVMATGYVPDTFGHNSQLPQILNGFGLTTAFWWRGLSGDEYGAEAWWEAPDGSRVLLNKLPEYIGYSNACALLPDQEAAARELEMIVRTQAARAATRHVLVMGGTDHLEPRDDWPELLALANARSTLAEFRFSTVEQYAQAVLSEIEGKPIPTVCGEQRDTSRATIGGGFVLPNTLSSRIYNKQQNAAAQTALERWAEPYSALLALAGLPYPRTMLAEAWRWLLQNHNHDCLCGCSVDPVHDQMEARFQQAQEIADSLTEEHFDWVSRQINDQGLDEGEIGVLIFNGLSWPVSGAVTVEVDLPLSQLAPLPEPDETPEDYAGHHAPLFLRHAERLWRPYRALPQAVRGLALRDVATGATLPVQIEAAGQAYAARSLRHGPQALERTYRLRVSVPLDELPAYGYRLLGARLTPLPNKHAAEALPANVLENQFLRATIGPHGTLTLLDKSTGEVYRDLAYFEDGGDAGDGYTYSYPAFDRSLNTLGATPRISRLAAGPVVQRYRIDYDLALPAGLLDDRRARRDDLVICPVSVTVSLGDGWRRLELLVSVDNRARDHRLRLVFPSDTDADRSHSDTPFDVVARPVQVTPVPPDRWIEDAPAQLPQQTFVDVSDGRRGLAILSVGLPEYEVEPGPRREVKVTLLRAVQYLGGEAELQTIRGGAGPHIATPGAQIQRRLTYRLAVFPHAGTWADAEVWREAHAHTVPPRSRSLDHDPTTPASSGPLPPALSLLAVTGANVVLSGVKAAEDDDRALIVRVFNPTAVPQTGWLRIWQAPTEVTRVRLDETPIGSPSPVADGVPLEVPPKQILTLKLSWESPPGSATGETGGGSRA